ncbi:MAG: glycoside hydrolase family 15 protein, partial [Thiobacillus sp.]
MHETASATAFGAPGINPTWSSSDKDSVGTALGPARVWFTLGHGIVNEVYYPRIDIPQIRDLGFIVGDGAGFWVEVKRLADYSFAVPAPGVPLPVIVHRHPRFTLTLAVCPDAARDVLLIDLALEGDAGLAVYALLAPHLGGAVEAREVLAYLVATQNDDGHWQQNQWLGGKPYWQGVQLDETALPVLLAAQLAQHDQLDGMAVTDCVRRALGFLMRRGPASPQDRWEEAAGVNAFTLAACIAALVAGAALLPEAERGLPLAIADYWNARVEDWCVARDTAIGRAHGIAAHYVRVAPVEVLCDDRAMQRSLAVKNRADDLAPAAGEQVALDFLHLVRLGLRRA